MNTVLAGRGRRMSVPLPASSTSGRPLGGICAAMLASAAAGGEPGGSWPAAAVTFGAVSGDTSCAELLAPARIKLDPARARPRNLCITTLLTQVEMQQHLPPFHLRARS